MIYALCAFAAAETPFSLTAGCRNKKTAARLFRMATPILFGVRGPAGKTWTQKSGGAFLHASYFVLLLLKAEPILMSPLSCPSWPTATRARPDGGEW